MENNMTAVEYLIEQLSNYDLKMIELFEKEIEQSKEMEKQQIIYAHGNQTKKSGGVSNYTYILTGEQYYNETYNN